MAGNSDLPPVTASAGELVVQGGRMAGTRRALGSPLTLIGSAPGCDIRLNVEGVAPLQSAIILGPDGPVFRDLAGGACRVDGRPVKSCRLTGGEVLELGPFHFRVELPPPATAEIANAAIAAAEHELEALRIQAAAVAAQQAALVEYESRLGQREAALERQESQLAALLAGRQKELDDAQRLAREQAEAFAREQAEARAAIAAERATLEKEKADARVELESAGKQRKKLKDLRRRLFRRAERQTAEAKQSAASREASAEAARRMYDAERGRLLAWYEKANGESELEKRRLQEGWRELALDQQRWDEALNAEKAERARLDKEQAGRAADLLAAREALNADQQRWRFAKTAAEQESRGLEARIAAQRQQLGLLERQVSGLRQAAAMPVEPIPAAVVQAPSAEDWPARLREVAGWLGDQRLHLLEQWERFLTVQHSWEEDRDSALSDIEQTAGRLEERERGVAQAERALHSRQAELSRRQQALESRRLALEGLQTRLSAQEAAWRAEREGRLEALAGAEQMAALRLRQYEQVHQRRNAVRAAESARLREALARADEARRQYGQAWQDASRLRQAVEARERSVQAGESALESARQQWTHQGADPAAAEARLAKLHREALARQEAATRELDAARRSLDEERSRLDVQAAALLRQENELAERVRSQRGDSEVWEAARVAADVEAQRREQEGRQARARHAIDERELRHLREELERLARALMEDGDEAEGAASAAA